MSNNPVRKLKRAKAKAQMKNGPFNRFGNRRSKRTRSESTDLNTPEFKHIRRLRRQLAAKKHGKGAAK